MLLGRQAAPEVLCHKEHGFPDSDVRLEIDVGRNSAQLIKKALPKTNLITVYIRSLTDSGREQTTTWALDVALA